MTSPVWRALLIRRVVFLTFTTFTARVSRLVFLWKELSLGSVSAQKELKRFHCKPAGQAKTLETLKVAVKLINLLRLDGFKLKAVDFLKVAFGQRNAFIVNVLKASCCGRQWLIYRRQMAEAKTVQLRSLRILISVAGEES